MDRATRAALIGALAGALIADKGDRVKGAAIGATFGAGAGFAYGQLKERPKKSEHGRLYRPEPSVGLQPRSGRLINAREAEQVADAMEERLSDDAIGEILRILQSRKASQDQVVITAEEANKFGLS